MLTAEQRELRRNYLGSSDMATIMNVSPYKQTANDVYWSKVAEKLPDEPTQAMGIGNWLELPLIQYACEQLEVEVTTEPDDLFAVSRDGILAANHDSLVLGAKAGIEAKFANGEMAKAYGSEYTDAVPDHVIVQTQHQMYCSGLELVYVSMATPSHFGIDRRIYVVPRDDVLIEKIVAFGTEWWGQHVLAKKPPDPNSGPPMYVLKAMERRKGAQATLGPKELEATIRMEIIKGEIKEGEAEVDDLKQFLIASFGDCDSGRLPDNRLLTWYESETSRIDDKALRAAKPQLAAEFTKVTASRTFRIRKK